MVVVPISTVASVAPLTKTVIALLTVSAEVCWIALDVEAGTHASGLDTRAGVWRLRHVVEVDAVAETNQADPVHPDHGIRGCRCSVGRLDRDLAVYAIDVDGIVTAYEHGLVQTVRRVADPDVMEWTERVRGTVGGLWGRWSPGTLADRCFVERW